MRRASGPVSPPADVPVADARRTITISGHGVEGWQSRNGTRPSQAARHRQVRRHERAGFRPDRAAMWAVMLGVLMLLAAAASSHAAVPAAHHGVAHAAHHVVALVAHHAAAPRPH